MLLKILFLSGLVLANILAYVLFIGAYAHFTQNPKFFFASCSAAAVLPLLSLFIMRKYVFSRYDGFTVVVMVICCALFILVFAIFGPVFIDRSISYHLAFYAVENSKISNTAVQSACSDKVVDKRLQDAKSAGFLIREADGTYAPTTKAAIFTAVMSRLGKLTGSLKNYEDMRLKVTGDSGR